MMTNSSICVAKQLFHVRSLRDIDSSEGIGYETIHQAAQQDELADGKSRNGYDREGACRRSEHPIGNLVGSAMRLSDQEVVDTVMLVVADHQTPSGRPVDETDR